jgi:hypothetical protein
MKLFPILLFLILPCLTFSCRSSGKPKRSEESRELARLGDPNPDAQIGGYYRLKGNVNGFYFHVPSFTEVLPNRYLMRRHIVQLLDSSVGDGWARVKNEDMQIGYVKFGNIRIVPYKDQPKPRPRDAEADLDQSMRAE